MKIASALAGLVLALTSTAWADHLTTQPEITNAAAFVPPVRYRSVFADTPGGVEKERIDWKKANADVGQFKNGFIDILKWEAQQEVIKNPGRPAAPAPVHQHGGAR